MAPITFTAQDAEVAVESRIDAALTPQALSALAFKGVTPTQAREYLRKRVALDIARAFAL